MKQSIPGLLCAVIVMAGCQADEQGASAPPTELQPLADAPPPAENLLATAEETAVALAALGRMSAFLDAQPRMRFEAEVIWDAVQPGGEVLEFGGWREVVLVRPDRVYAESQDRNGGVDQVIFDGTTLTVALADLEIYAQIERPGGVDAALGQLGDEIGVPIPLADLIQHDLYGAVAGRVLQARRMGRAHFEDVVCEHFWYRAAAIDFELWIAEGESPLPRRMVIRYRDQDAQPSYRALFSGWDLAPETSDQDFSFEPAAGARAVGFDTVAEALR